MQGNLDKGCELAQEAVAFSRAVGDKASIADSLHDLAFLLLERGEYDRARSLCEERLELSRELGNKAGIASALFSLAQTLFFSLGNQVRIRTLLEEGHMLSKEVGDRDSLAYWSYLAGWAALYEGDTASARTLLEAYLQLNRERGDRHAIADGLSVLGRIALAHGDLKEARVLYEESLAGAGEIGDKLIIAPSLEGLAEVVSTQGEAVWAARLWGAAEGLRATIGSPILPVERIPYEKAVATARIQLGEPAFTASWAEGRNMTPEQALAAQGTTDMHFSATTVPPSTPRALTSPVYPAGLTAREVEVLRLVAQGLSDANIAEQLVISPRTVNWHLTSIYSKLGVSSRAAATRYAIEHHVM